MNTCNDCKYYDVKPDDWNEKHNGIWFGKIKSNKGKILASCRFTYWRLVPTCPSNYKCKGKFELK